MLLFRQIKYKNLVGIKCVLYGFIQKDVLNAYFYKFYKVYCYIKFDIDMYYKIFLLLFEYKIERYFFYCVLRIGRESRSYVNIWYLKVVWNLGFLKC